MANGEGELSEAAKGATYSIAEILGRLPAEDLPLVLEATFRDLGSTTLDLIQDDGDNPQVRTLSQTASQVGNWIAAANIHR